jgi:hypothetical protein
MSVPSLSTTVRLAFSSSPWGPQTQISIFDSACYYPFYSVLAARNLYSSSIRPYPLLLLPKTYLQGGLMTDWSPLKGPTAWRLSRVEGRCSIFYRSWLLGHSFSLPPCIEESWRPFLHILNLQDTAFFCGRGLNHNSAKFT